MLQMLAFKIDKNSYPIAAALLPSDFLVVPKKQTYGNFVVINQPVGYPSAPVKGKGHARRIRAGAQALTSGMPRYGRPRTSDLGRVKVEFENSWYDSETFHAEFVIRKAGYIQTDHGEIKFGRFFKIERREDPTFEGTTDGDVDDESCGNPACHCHEE